MGEWNNEIARNLGFTYTGLNGKSAADFGEGAPYIPYMNVFTNTIVDTEFFEYVKVGERENQNKVKLGDVLFTTSSETPEEVGMSSVLVTDCGLLYLNSFCFGFRLYNKKTFNSIFLAYLMRSDSIRKQMLISAQGSTRHNLSKKNFYATVVFYPVAIEEQRKIAEILSTIDEAIDSTRALLAKYRNVKTGLMQALLGSGALYTIEECFRLRARIGWQGLRSDEFTDNGPYLVTGTDFVDGKIDWDTCYHVNEQRYKQDVGIQLHENDLLITKDGTIGKTAIVHNCPDEVTLNSGVFVVRPIGKKVLPEYLYYVLNSHQFDLFMRNMLTGSTIKHLNQEHFNKLQFIAPDVPKQKEIVEILNAAEIRLQSERNYLSKLKATKQGLMQDLLTNTVSVDALVV
ncbi:MAG: restriction endonuclease subunit S [Armatimonadota bacterium]